MKKINIIQVGVGHDHAIFTYNSIIKLTDCFNYLGTVLFDEYDKEFVSTYDDYKAYPILTLEEALKLDNVEAVAIETTETSSTEAATIFAKKGIAVHLDKPGTQNIASFLNLLKICEENNTELQLGYMYRFNPAVIKAMQFIKEGKIGSVYAVEAHMSILHTDDKRRWVGKFKGGMMYYLGCHLVDLILQIKGMPQEVIPLNAPTDKTFIDSEDYGFAILKYPDGVSFAKTCSNEVNGFARRRINICGTKGTIVIAPIEEFNADSNGQATNLRATYKITTLEDNPINHLDCSKKYSFDEFDRYDNMMTEFAKITAKEIKNPYPLEYEKDLFLTLMKCCDYKD